MRLSTLIQDTLNHTTVDETMAKALAYFAMGMRSDAKILGMDLNLFVVGIGPSSISHKSTAVKYVLQDFTTYSLGTSSGLSKIITSKGSYTLWDDEFGRFLKGVKGGSQGYKDIVDMLNTLYDGGNYTFPSTSNRPKRSVSNVKVGIVGTTTKAAFLKNCSKELLEGGFLKRCLLILLGRGNYRSARYRSNKKPVIPFSESFVEREFSDEFWRVHDTFMEEKYAIKDESLAATWARAEGNIFKLAAIHAISERWDDTITVEDWKEVVSLVEHSVVSQKILMEMM